MTIKKRNGDIVEFNKDKIIVAVTSAFLEVDKYIYEEETINDIADDIEAYYLNHPKKEATVEEVQDMIEEYLMRSERKDVARAYIRYRYRKEINRQTGKTYDSILELVDLANEELKEENSNKNATVASTQRDYMAGEVSKDLAHRVLLPADVIRAHDMGIIHFHDMDYYAQHVHNCFSRDTKFITTSGLKSFKDFNDGDIIEVFGLDGKPHKAVVKNYGKQQLNEYTFYNGKKEHFHSIKATPNHRWILKDGSETTNLKIGDKLVKPPVMYNQDMNWDNLPYDCKLAWCKGFGLGDGTVESQGQGKKSNRTRIRLCGDKDLKFITRFEIEGCSIRNTKFDNDDKEIVIYHYHKEIPEFKTTQEMQCFLNGLYCADGNMIKNKNGRINFRLQSSKKEVIDFIRNYADSCGLYITKERETTGEKTNFGTRPYTVYFSFNPDFAYSYTVLDIKPGNYEEVWCLEVEDTHNFILEYGIPTGNCCLVNLEDMLQNGTVINKTMIEKPHSFATACNIATQIMAVVASGQYGGQSVSLAHLAPFVDISRQKIRKDVIKELEIIEYPSYSDFLINDLVERRVREEVSKGVQTIQYQINTLNTSNGQTPFVTIFMYLGEVEDPTTKADLALIIEEILKQRIKGVKNEKGVWITPAFPKLIYTLEKDNITEDAPYWYLTELAAKCTAKRLVPDYISEKIMKELKLSTGEKPGEGDVYTCMGCRSFLTPDRSAGGFNNIANAKNYMPGKPKYYGRFNQGVVTINLVDVACSAIDESDFWNILDTRLGLCHKALQERHKRLKGTISDISPIHWQHGALARLEKGETIDKLLYDGYSTLSLGYAGLWECVYRLSGKKLTELEGKELGLKIMRALNDACAAWKANENIDYSLYGTPIESTTYKFAKCLKKRFGIIPGVTDKDYITNSYHVHVTEPIDAFSKIALEAEFQALSPGGAISYVEVPNLNNNIPAVLEVIKFIYDNIIYAELNTKSDYCQECGWDGEIEIVKDEETGKLVWECPNCGNRNQDTMNVARRTCGYIGSNFWNQGRTEEIAERVLHL